MKNERCKSGITIALYETDGSIYDFDAVVVDCFEVTDVDDGRYAIILDKTAFFPEGGGQAADAGSIADIPVIDVQTDDEGRILHYTYMPIEKGSKVKGLINRDIRFRRMQNHTAEHLLSGLIHKEFGYDNVGFHMMEAGARLDVNGTITDEQLEELEYRANMIVYENASVIISFPTKEEARNLEYRSKLDTYEGIRLVTIEGVDSCACCAPHLSSTGQIGIIKIIDAMPHRGGMRITMVAGLDAYDDYSKLHVDNKSIMGLLSSKREDTVCFVSDLLDRQTELKVAFNELERSIADRQYQEILAEIGSRIEGDMTPIVIFTDVLDNVALRNLINDCTSSFSGLVAGFRGNDAEGYKYIMSCGDSNVCDLQVLAKSLNAVFSGKGGGNKQMVQGSLAGSEKDIRKYLNL